MDTDRLLRELTDFLRIPSVSTSASHNADCRAAAEWVAGELRRLGCREVQFLASDTHPVVWGVGREVPGAPTLLIYGHYDVQPPEPLDEWTTPPFEPTVRDGKLFARGAADDKGQVFCLLKAIEGQGGRPPCPSIALSRQNTWPLSSAAPRANSLPSRTVGSNGGVVHSSSGSGGCTS